MTKREAPIYKVIFLNQGQVFEMYAKQIYQSDLWGFLEVEEFVFGERTQVVVDPSEEKLKAQFDGVVRSFVPMHSIGREQYHAVPDADARQVSAFKSAPR